MNKKLIPVLLASAALLPGCFEEKAKETGAASSAPVVAKEDAIAVVNGTYISKQTLQTLENEIMQRSQGQQFPKQQLVEELVQRELLVQDALKKQLDKSPEFVERMTAVRNSLLSQAALQNYLQSNPITDDDLKAEYDAKIGSAGTEYKARHILVKTEEEAKQLIDELSKGADFVELAKSKSTGPSGPQGGDLGWFTPDRMVAPFSEAVVAMENGQFSSKPVETQFGWHVILREDSRAQTPPPFEAVKEQIRPMLQRQKIQSMIAGLRNQAKVEILIPLTEDTAGSAEDEAQSEDVQTESAEEGSVAETVENAAEEAAQAAGDVAEKTANAVEEAVESGEKAVQETAEKIKGAAESAADALKK